MTGLPRDLFEAVANASVVIAIGDDGIPRVVKHRTLPVDQITAEVELSHSVKHSYPPVEESSDNLEKIKAHLAASYNDRQPVRIIFNTNRETITGMVNVVGDIYGVLATGRPFSYADVSYIEDVRTSVGRGAIKAHLKDRALDGRRVRVLFGPCATFVGTVSEAGDNHCALWAGRVSHSYSYDGIYRVEDVD